MLFYWENQQKDSTMLLSNQKLKILKFNQFHWLHILSLKRNLRDINFIVIEAHIFKTCKSHGIFEKRYPASSFAVMSNPVTVFELDIGP